MEPFPFHSRVSITEHCNRVVVDRVDNGRTGSGPAAMIEQLRQAVNDHDLAALAACFAPGYRNETPAHPRRGFTGREQVRRNWQQIFAAIPDLTAELLRSAVDGDTVWTEWEHRG